MAQEVGAIADSAWMAHPQRMQGNSAVALISRGGEDNDEFVGAMAETPHLRGCPYIRQVLASFGVVLGRSRLMKLATGAEVATHVDFNYHWHSRVRIHIPIITSPEVTFFCADQNVNMRAGESWIFNAWRRHRVSNDSDQDRVHLVIDTVGSSQFWAVVREMEQYDPIGDAGRIDRRVEWLQYRPGTDARLVTEQFNVAPVMAPGEVDALVDGVVREIELNPDNDKALASRYELMLRDFARDWRAAWLVHGYQSQGWATYRQLIDKVARQLQPAPQALLTHSNRIRINQVIVHRILAAALAEDVLDSFVASGDPRP